VVPPNNIATFDESEMSVEPPNNITTTESTSNINQELEYAPEDYIVQAIEDSTTEEPQPDNGEIPNVEDHTSDIAHDINNTNNENDEEEMAEIMTAEDNFDNCYGIRTSHYNLRPSKERNYSHIHTMIEEIVMTQYPMHKGIKVFGDAGTRAVIEELQQLHERQVIEPCNADKMSMTEKSDALEYLMFLKKKLSGIIKGRGCADGRK
jgi:hypothetical protein